jgi:hypothetical protein
LTSVRQIAANQGNAQRATGPRTVAGKARSAQNAMRHGILARAAVLPVAETEGEWVAHCDAILAGLDPVGGLELHLAERVALALWRLRRVARFETEVLSLVFEDLDAGIVEADERVTAAQVAAQFSSDLIGMKGADPVDGWQARRLVERACDLLGVECCFSPGIGNPQDAKQLRSALRQLAEDVDESVKQIELRVMDDDADNLVKAKRIAAWMRTQRARKRRLATVPTEGHLDRIMRYEGHLERSLSRSLAELRLLQANRPSGPILDGFVSREA